MEFINSELAIIVATIWESVLGLPCVESGDEPVSPQHSISACVQITGGWKGAVLLSCPQPFAAHAAAIMFNTGSAESSLTDMQDAVAELTNMIGGNLKGILPDAEACQLSLPSVVAGADYTARVPGSRPVTQLTMDCGGKAVLITVLEKTPVAVAA